MKPEKLIAIAAASLAACGVSNATVVSATENDGTAVIAQQKVHISKIGELADLVNQQDAALQVVRVEDGLATVKFTSADSLMAGLANATVKVEMRATAGLLSLQEGRCPPDTGRSSTSAEA